MQGNFVLIIEDRKHYSFKLLQLKRASPLTDVNNNVKTDVYKRRQISETVKKKYRPESGALLFLPELKTSWNSKRKRVKNS